jgi:hypothetical protein
MTKQAHVFLELRARVRAILDEAPITIVPGAELPDDIDCLINDLVERLNPSLAAGQSEIYAQLTDHAVLHDVDSHIGRLMITWGPAGYFVGLAAGLELAALTGGAR